MEGEFARIPKAGDLARRDVPTCHLSNRVGEVYERCQALGWKVCLVVNEQNSVLGRLRREAWDADPDTPVQDVMENGPSPRSSRPTNGRSIFYSRSMKPEGNSIIGSSANGEITWSRSDGAA